MRNITEDQCNSTEEVCGLFRTVFANQEQLEAKIVQNAQEIEALKPKKKPKTEPKAESKPKPKKKGKSKMKSKGSASMRVIAILMLIVALAGLGYAAYVPGDINYDIASNPESLSIYLRDVTNNMRSNTYVFTPRATAPLLPVEGMVYYNSVTDAWIGYVTETGWQTFDVAGGNTLVGAYNSGGAGVGRTILALDGAVVISNNTADAAPLLELTYTGGAVDAHGLIVTTNATGAAIEIEHTGAGADIEGTAGWTISKVGALIALDADFTGADGIILQEDETITQPEDGSIMFTSDEAEGNTLIFDMDDGNTSILIDSGDVVTLDWGTVDNFTSVETIVFDNAATSAISMTGTGTNDLLITQLGVTTQSLVLNSDGNVADAIDIDTLGGLDVDTTLSIVLTSVEDQPDAIVIQATLGGIDIRTDAAGAGDDIDITATLGSIDLLATEDAANAITLTANGGVSETIVITSTLGTGADAITIVGTAGGIDVDAVDDINIAVASTAAGDDLALVQTGAVNASITLAAAGTGVDAIDLNASAGGIDIDSALAMTIDNAAGDISLISAAGSVVISASEDAVDAINIDSTAGGIDIDAVGEPGQDIIITNTGGSIALVSTESAVNSIVLQSTLGGIDIQCDAATSEDIDILNTGGSINLIATESAVDSIVIQSTLGGIDIDCAAATSEDIDITNTGGSINLVSTENAGDSIVLQSTLGGIDIQADASGDEDIDISNTGGNVHIVSDADATDAFDLDVTGTNGGVDIDTTDGPIVMTTAGAANGDVTIDASDKITILSSDVQAAGILLQVDGGAAETIHINSTAGTTAAAINIDADVGGITILADGATAGDILIDAEDRITLTTDDENAGAVTITSAAGGAAASTIIITNTAGTAVATAGATTAAIQLHGVAGGIGLYSTFNNDNAVRIEANGGANETIIINSNQGTGADSITLDSDLGGITLLADSTAGNILLDAENNITITSADQDADGIDIGTGAAGHANSTIHVHNETGTAVDSIEILTDAGGVTITSNVASDDGININAIAGGVDVTAALQLSLVSTETAVDAIVIDASDGGGGMDIDAGTAGINVRATSGDININTTGAAGDRIDLINTTGTGVSVASAETAAIQLYADAGGIGLNSGINAINAIRIEADGGTSETIVIHANLGNTATSITLMSDDGGVTISGGADDSITMTTGSAGGATGNVIFTNGQTRKLMFFPMHVELDGASPPALATHGTNGQTNISILEFDANPAGGTGDDTCYISWMVPDGYIVDSARLNIGYLFDTAEGAGGDEAQFDFTVNAVAAGEAPDGAGSGLVDQPTVVGDATADNGLLHISQYAIEVEEILVNDLVTIQIAVDESDSAWDQSGTCDVLYFEIEWESTE